MKNKVFLNGTIYNAKDAKVSLFDRGYLFSDGIYELIPYFNSKPFLLEDHYKRLQESLKMIGLENPYTKKEWFKNINDFTNNSEYKNYYLYIQVTRGAPKDISDGVLREHAATKNYITAVSMFYSEIDNLQKKNIIGKKSITMEDKRWKKCNIKSISLLFNSYAKTLAYKEGAYEAILIRDDVITEGCSSNVFIVKNNIIKTAPKSNLILPGVTRSFVIEKIIKENGNKLLIENFSKNELLESDEVFITNSTQGILPITIIDNMKINEGICGEITKELYKTFIKYTG